MNELIQKLFSKSCWDEQAEVDIEDFISVERFAELIVAECLDVALAQKKWVEDQVAFDPIDATWNEARIQQSQRIVEKIKQHFGVEE